MRAKLNAMKKTFTLLATALCISVFAQTTITLRPNTALGKDAQVNNYGGNASTNFGTSPVIASYVWTNGTVFTNKFYIQFDLSSLPANAVVTSASLDLYADNPTTTFVGNPSTPMNGSNNASYIKRVTSSWDESTITWNSQPTATGTHQVTLPQSNSTTQNYLGVDVTQLVSDMVVNGNNGFLVEPITNQPSNSMIFRSSDYQDSAYWPSLTVTYTLSNCFSLRPDAAAGKDAQVNDYGANASTNFGSSPVIASYVWTNGTVFNNKFYLQFDLSGVPANAVIDIATLDLYADNPTTTFVGNPSTPMNGSDNASAIKRVTAAWNENTVTWNNQPTSTTTNQGILPQSTSATQNYLGVDVKQLVQDMITYGNNGFLIEPITTQPSNSMIFRSSDNADSASHPRLNICYSIPSAINEANTSEAFRVYPNPFTDQVVIDLEGLGNDKAAKVQITNALGQLIWENNVMPAEDHKMVLSKSDLTNATGLLLVNVVTGSAKITRKLLSE